MFNPRLKPKHPRLRPKYVVRRTDADGVARGPSMKSTDTDDVNSPFVLMPRKDPAAFAAMVAYAEICEQMLSSEIITWLEKIAKAEPVFGSQGRRNFEANRMEALQSVLAGKR